MLLRTKRKRCGEKFIETFPQKAVAYITFLNTCLANQPDEEERMKFVENLFKDI